MIQSIKRNYFETLNLLAMEEGLMEDNIESSTSFLKFSSYNEIIDSVNIVIKEIIQNKINYAN